MTAPLTPSDQPSEPPAPGSGAQPHPAYPTPAHAAHGAGRHGTGPGLRAELRDAAVITGALTAAGALLGVLWVWLAPRVQMVLIGNAVYPKNSESEEAIGADGTFVLIGLGAGLVTAAVVFCFRRAAGVPVVLALALGGLLGSWLGWRFGVFLGPDTDIAASAREAGERVTFDGPLELGAKGALLAWPVAAMVTQLILTGLFGPRDPEPDDLPYATGQPATTPHQADEDPPGPPAGRGLDKGPGQPQGRPEPGHGASTRQPPGTSGPPAEGR
ncbi:hypothetical protein [Streptomyces buecherae]|uniref:ABC transporter permease n=1 Tax=Streptomyces buecherae TaxID=2763006 RepID=A0A7H8N4X7_9ACTN|nr:hypothetical protein HUT08_07345 [Streptomyces buecherae]